MATSSGIGLATKTDGSWTGPAPGLPWKVLRLFREARWIGLCFLGVLLLMVLLSYNPADPGWSQEVSGREVTNFGGRIGAWIADFMLYLFGLSAYWFSGFLLIRVIAGYRELHHHELPRAQVEQVTAAAITPGQKRRAEGILAAQTAAAQSRRFPWERWLGFVILLLGCTGLEAARFHSHGASLPLAPGGLIGTLIATPVHDLLGNVGGTLALLLMFAVGFSLATGISWLNLFEHVGRLIERGIHQLQQSRAAREDRRLGEAAAGQRDQSVDEFIAQREGGRSRRAVQRMPGEDDDADPSDEIESRRGGARAGLAAERASRRAGESRAEPFVAAGGSGRRTAGAGAGGIDDDDIDDDDVLDAGVDGGGDASGGRIGNELAARFGDMRAATAASFANAAGATAALVERLKITKPAEVVKSDKAERERQAPLFNDLSPEAGELPPLALLEPPPDRLEVVSQETLEYTSRLIEKKLKDFGVVATVVAAHPGPVITLYEIEPATGVKGAQIVNLAKDLARALSLVSLRVVETIPGKNLMGLELPNPRRQAVRLSEILGSQAFAQPGSALTMALGKDISGGPVVSDLAKMPHLLVAGTTGSGKSVGINAMLISLLYKADPSQVRMILIDPKMLEMSVYEGIPHLLAPVVTDMTKAGHALNWCVGEMERRYRLMSKFGVRGLAGFNAKIADAAKRDELIPNPFSLTPDAPEPLSQMPQIVVVIDELADLMMVVGKKIEELIARLAQKARAAGIHLILATQRPSVDVITGLIKANVPSRISFQVSSKIDSRTILDEGGAESLLGMGDMLFKMNGSNLSKRVHGAYVDDNEVHRVAEYWRARGGEPDYVEGILEGGLPEGAETGSAVGFGGLSQTLADAGADGESDEMYDQAVAIVLQHRKASISLVQRHLRIGYNRAARLLEQMEKSGLVSAMQSNGNRAILVPGSGGAGE